MRHSAARTAPSILEFILWRLMTEVDRLLEVNDLAEMTPRIVEEAGGQRFFGERKKALAAQPAAKIGASSEGRR